MQIVFKQVYLSNLYHGMASDKKHRFPPEVIKKYVKVVNVSFHSLNYKKLSGDLAGIESVRVNDKYRLEFRTEKSGEEFIVTVCNILELSNHYQ